MSYGGWGETTSTLVSLETRVQASNKEQEYGLVRPYHHMVVVAFPMTLLVNKLTIIVVPTYC